MFVTHWTIPISPDKVIDTIVVLQKIKFYFLLRIITIKILNNNVYSRKYVYVYPTTVIHINKFAFMIDPTNIGNICNSYDFYFLRTNFYYNYSYAL